MPTFSITVEERVIYYETRTAYLEASSFEEAEQRARNFDFDDYGEILDSNWADGETVDVFIDTLEHDSGELPRPRPTYLVTRRKNA